MTSESGRVDPLSLFSPLTEQWFASELGAPTEAQAQAWQAIADKKNALVIAPTGSGKTLAAFLWSIDKLSHERRPDDERLRCRTIYISPLKALAYDVERNLRYPLDGISALAVKEGVAAPDVTVAMRTGDTPAPQRRAFARHASDILITTPESLFLLLTSQARDKLRGVTTVIVDEVHALAGTKRGAHLALSLERLDALLSKPAQRIGLSATVKNPTDVAHYLGGTHPVEIVQPVASKMLQVDVEVPVPDMTAIPETDGDGRKGSIWPAVERRVYKLIGQHKSTIVFVNARAVAEKLCARLNELAEGNSIPASSPAQYIAQSPVAVGVPPVVARAHHGSVSREERLEIEESLKNGTLRAVVATSSLELGIDMGAVDLVIQVGSPPSVASGLQRVGRAGHQVGAISHGVFLPLHRADLLQASVVAEKMRARELEELAIPRNPLDVLAQQIVAMVAVDSWTVDKLAVVVRRTASYRSLPNGVLEAVLDMLSGRYPSTQFAALRPRLVWDRSTGELTARPGAQLIAVTSGGTIPDRGNFGVFLVNGGPGSRVGELDEQMVYESRVGDVFALGTSSWRIEEITHDRVLVSPAPGRAARVPFWTAEFMDRPVELGKALARKLSTIADDHVPEDLNDNAASNLVAYIKEQRSATKVLPDDRTVVVERFRDALGDWRVVIHCLLGARVTAPWAQLISRRLEERYSFDPYVAATDDGIVIRFPDTEKLPSADFFLFSPDEVASGVTETVESSALFAARFRECAARALLLPRRDPSRRQPLWQQRQRSTQLLDAAREFDEFPIIAEAARECLHDVYDVPALEQLMASLASRVMQLVDVTTPSPSPFARNQLMAYMANFLYAEDTPSAERRAATLSADSALLAELLGEIDYTELLSSEVVVEAEKSLQWRDGRVLRDAEDVAELLRTLGDVSVRDVAQRRIDPSWLDELIAAERAVAISLAGDLRYIAIEDAARYRDGCGATLPDSIAKTWLTPGKHPLMDLIHRYARTHGPFTAKSCAAHLTVSEEDALHALHALSSGGHILGGSFSQKEVQWCHRDVLALLRRRSLAALRAEIAPVEPAAYGRFLPSWHRIGEKSSGLDGLVAACEQLQGYAMPASAVEKLILPARLDDYSSSYMDELMTSGELMWAGVGALPSGDGWVMLTWAENASLLLPEPDLSLAKNAIHEEILDLIDREQTVFFRDLRLHLGEEDSVLVNALWDLVWAGYISNDTFAPLRSALSGRGTHHTRPTAPRSHTRRPRPTLTTLRSGPPVGAGRWYRLPVREHDVTSRLAAQAETLVERSGVVLRGAVSGEGGFSAVYPVLSAMEQRGIIRRGYFVDGCGAAQFADLGAVDRLRDVSREDAPATDSSGGTASAKHSSSTNRDISAQWATVTLAATDPANPYGAQLPWPARTPPDATIARLGPRYDSENGPASSNQRPGRRAGALVVLDGGELVLYVERGGKTTLVFTNQPERLERATQSLVDTLRAANLGSFTIESVNGMPVVDTPLGVALRKAGFGRTPKGLRLK